MPPDPNGWERWRGEIEHRSTESRERITALEDWRVDHEDFARKAMSDIVEQITRVRLRIMWMTGVGAGAGAVLGSLLAWVLGKL